MGFKGLWEELVVLAGGECGDVSVDYMLLEGPQERIRIRKALKGDPSKSVPCISKTVSFSLSGCCKGKGSNHHSVNVVDRAVSCEPAARATLKGVSLVNNLMCNIIYSCNQ